MIDASETPDPFTGRFTWHRPRALDVAAMRRAVDRSCSDRTTSRASACVRSRGDRPFAICNGSRSGVTAIASWVCARTRSCTRWSGSSSARWSTWGGPAVRCRCSADPRRAGSVDRAQGRAGAGPHARARQVRPPGIARARRGGRVPPDGAPRSAAADRATGLVAVPHASPPSRAPARSRYRRSSMSASSEVATRYRYLSISGRCVSRSPSSSPPPRSRAARRSPIPV